jgi:tetratricopeptide (TPR) repeat protein
VSPVGCKHGIPVHLAKFKEERAMCLKRARWLAGGSLFAAMLLVQWGGPAAAQDAQQPGQTIRLVDETGQRKDSPAVEVSPREEQPAEKTPSPVEEKPLVPIPDPVGSAPVQVEAASFKGVTPGVTTMEELEKTWGAPKEISKQKDTVMQLYAVEPFKRVEVSYFNKRVASVVIRFDRAFPANTVAQQLELANVRPVLVSNELGEILGQVYPERGVLFAFEPSKEPGKASMHVDQIILEPITAEPFVLRAETNLDSRYDLALKDLEQALKLQPANARAHWLRSRILLATGEYEKADVASAEAVRLEPGNPHYRVTRAQILGLLGRLVEATQEARKAVETSQQRPHVKARALCLLGDLAASGPKPDYREAIQFHTQAVEEAGVLTADPHPAIRLAAKEVLVDAHLGAAHDIAWGNWKQKEAALSKWLTQADAFAEDLVEKEGRSPELRFRVSTRALAAYVGMRGKLDPSKWADAAIRTGKELIATTEDPVRKARLQWDLGMALYDALQTCQMRSEHDTALKYGEWAIEYLEQGEQGKRSPATSYLLGRLYFRLGAIHAIRDENHRAAITWFDKALPLLEGQAPNEALADQGRHGETFVSMGVSYWEAGEREKAVQVTQRGLELMEQAVKQGTLDRSALAIPYSNLASMNRQLGQKEKAEQFEKMAARLQDTKIQ